MDGVRLQSLAGRFWSESELVVRRFSYVFPPGHGSCSEFHLWRQEMCVIRLLDAWARFCRELVLISSSEQPLTAGGTRLPLAPGITGRKDALRTLRTLYTRFPWEPRWTDAQACLKAANLLGIANYSTISTGIAVTPSPLEDLGRLRNFLAHRNEGTAAEVRAAAVNVGMAPTSNVIAILRTVTGASTLSVLQLWIKQLQTMAQIAARLGSHERASCARSDSDIAQVVREIMTPPQPKCTKGEILRLRSL
jgi:hypothetical protein